MKARHIDGLWEVTDEGKFWTVTHDDLILNADLRQIKPDGPLGRKILAAVKEADR